MRLLKGVECGPVSRRHVLILAVSACAPVFPAWAQRRSAMPIVGFLAGAEEVQAMVKLLGELGYIEGRNLRVEAVAGANMRALPDAAARLLQHQPDVVVASGPAVMALAAFTRTVPIVCEGVPDPVGAGLAQSLARPGGNVTGLSTGTPDTAPIVFGLLKQMRPGIRRVAVLHSEGAPVQVQMRAHGEAARAAGLEWILTPINSIDDAAKALPPLAGEAAWMGPLGHPRIWRPTLELAHKHRIATIGGYPGTLMWYSRSFSDAPRRVAAIIDKILKGAKPGDIPFEVPDRPAFTLNRSTARAVGIEIPQDVLLRATELVD
jgi:putative tryptophan/tyrosine transport system substrate-binding protein